MEWNNPADIYEWKIFYHANAIHSQWGKVIHAKRSRNYLPFDHPFNLLLHIGVRSFKFSGYDLYSESNHQEGLTKSWISPVFEIDYIRIYGESIQGFDKEFALSNNENNSTIIYAFIGSIGFVIILVIFIIIGIVYLTRKRKQEVTQENNDDICEVENNYESFNYDYTYDDEINQRHQGEYLALTDPMVDQNQNYEIMRETFYFD